jgi:hypothetical protein
MIEKTSTENLPPAFAEAASRRQVTPLACLCGREKIAKEGKILEDEGHPESSSPQL